MSRRNAPETPCTTVSSPFELAVNVAVVSPVAFQISEASATMPRKVGSVGSSNFRVR